MDPALDIITKWFKQLPYQGGLHPWVTEEKHSLKIYIPSVHIRGRLRAFQLLKLYEMAKNQGLRTEVVSGCVVAEDVKVCVWEERNIISTGGLLIVVPKTMRLV